MKLEYVKMFRIQKVEEKQNKLAIIRIQIVKLKQVKIFKIIRIKDAQKILIYNVMKIIMVVILNSIVFQNFQKNSKINKLECLCIMK